jgi:hypothetical protein
MWTWQGNSPKYKKAWILINIKWQGKESNSAVTTTVPDDTTVVERNPFEELLDDLHGKNPKVFRLPECIINHFEGSKYRLFLYISKKLLDM